MNYAEERRNRQIAVLPDLVLLNRVLDDDETTPDERKAFDEMRANLLSGERRRLSQRQRSWVEEVARRLTPISAADVPRGNPVETPEVLRHLPKKPPGRPANG